MSERRKFKRLSAVKGGGQGFQPEMAVLGFSRKIEALLYNAPHALTPQQASRVFIEKAAKIAFEEGATAEEFATAAQAIFEQMMAYAGRPGA